MIDRDSINHVCPERVAQVALDALDRTDQGDTNVQIVGLAAALMAIVQRTSAEANHILTVARNILGSKHADTPSHQAIQEYIHHEISAWAA
ncbi:hypothetical protein LO749_20930 [Paracoccus denitrificans]|uniref:hypothetical protein n=1 Tax=Paracoccus denitrificans TaxID=266 RepID=UPI001E3E8D44|nr:hypothetical protein [Paracoccus denitrificans]UFS66960.1 hypothetical protein LO749_20930 [Paracoccus denitrificans]